jgi:hypothetical protein
MRHFTNQEVRDIVQKERGYVVTRVLARIESLYALMYGTVVGAEGFPKEPTLVYEEQEFEVTAMSFSELRTYCITMVSDGDQLIVKRERWDRL